MALAARSLAWLSESMGPAWRLEVGHMGYLSGLMEALAVPALARQEILARLRARNSHGLRAAALAAGLSAEGAEALAALLTFCGPAPAGGAPAAAPSPPPPPPARAPRPSPGAARP